MKPSKLMSVACMLATFGCSTSLPVGLGEQPTTGDQVAGRSRSTESTAKQPVRRGGSQEKSGSPDLNSKASAPPLPDRPLPDAVIKFNPGSDQLSRDMEARLAGVAQQAREDERTMLRLEGYVPDGGSPALNLGIAEQSLQLIKKRLVDLNISPRRILLVPFGEEHRTERDIHRHWVEIYLVRPRL
jgi:outer membrane protein OmpA-like peptidoglycan-associated protein